MNTLFKEQPKIPKVVAINKGTQILEGLLLGQYAHSPKLKEYMLAFIVELDFLYTQIEEVYLGRFLSNAVGEQLDVIGIILQQSRNIILPNLWFGFEGAPLAEGMASEDAPAIGGLFKDEDMGLGELVPLDDSTYRRLLTAKAAILNQDTANIDVAYFVISTLIGRVPNVFIMEDIGFRQVRLSVSGSAVSLKDVTLTYYMAKYFVPTGTTFTILRV